MSTADALEGGLGAARALLGERLAIGTAVREHHARGEDSHPPRLPDAVAFPETTDEVSRLLALCAAHRIPVVAYGTGTSLEGQVTPVAGGISLDFSRMDQLLELNEADMDCLVQPGLTRRGLERRLRGTGLFFPVDPGADCSIGGMVGTRASGTNAVRYGTIRENVLGLEAVLADGRVIRTGGRVRKQATGYDLTHLLIGSEGTLAVTTAIRLRLHPLPEAIAAAVCQFATLEGAVRTVMATLQAAVPIARIELLDDTQMGACIAYSHLEGLAPAPTLFLEFHGTEAGVAEQADIVALLAAEHGGGAFHRARREEDRQRLWRARHDVYWACRALRPDHGAMTTDSIVPPARLAEAVLATKAAIAEAGLTAPIVGHVGDGNFHTVILIPPGPDGLERAWALDRRIVGIAQGLGGSCSGEHGVGLGKRAFLAREHGAAALDLMRAIKAAIDPLGILNPGKLLPDPDPAECPVPPPRARGEDDATRHIV
jgi:D-lactate dehydrogenase (cytochrome)